jgi:glycosyltransferase involved in cell wall biosynthesis
LIGGAEKVLSYLARAFAAEGADVTVITSSVPGVELPAVEHWPVPDSDPEKGKLTVVRLETSKRRFWGTWIYMRNLDRWFRNHPVDLAYVSMLKHDAYTVLGVARRLRFPVVLRPEGAGATGDVAWQSWGNFGRRIGLRCRNADMFVTISESITRELRDAWTNGPMRSARWLKTFDRTREAPPIAAIANGVPIPDEPWRSKPLFPEEPRALFVGRLAPEKGLDTLIRAWPFVRGDVPKARLVLIGDGPERPALEALARSLGVSRAVEMSGVSSDATAALRDGELFVLPSREEGMSIALLEAMALGIPLVASSIPGNQRLVTDREHGRIAPVDNPEALARVIVEQWTNWDEAIAMGHAARRRVETEFSIRAVARRHLALFQDVIARRHWPAAGNGDALRSVPHPSAAK